MSAIDAILAPFALAVGIFNLGFVAGAWWFARGERDR